jgi:hypothetical protein
VRALDHAGIPWTEVFISKGAAVVGATAAIGLAVAVLAKRAAPSGTIDIGETFSLPSLPTQDVMLYSALHDRRSRHARCIRWRQHSKICPERPNRGHFTRRTDLFSLKTTSLSVIPFPLWSNKLLRMAQWFH